MGSRHLEPRNRSRSRVNISSRDSILLTCGVEAHLIGLTDNALKCDGFWVSEGETVRVSKYYFCRFVVRPNTKRDSYTAHPIAEENILRERRREAPSKKPCMPRSLNTAISEMKTRSKTEALTFHTAKKVGTRPRYLSSRRTCILVYRQGKCTSSF